MSGISLSAPVTPYPLTDFSANTAAASLQADKGENSANTAEVDKVSTDFEAVFLSQMLGAMFEGDDLTQFFGGGSAGEIYKSFLMNEYGKSIAKAGGIGIATQVRKELLKLQEVA